MQDLASRFADGRLTNERLVEADDEGLARLLIEVRGIGRVWVFADPTYFILMLIFHLDTSGLVCVPALSSVLFGVDFQEL